MSLGKLVVKGQTKISLHDRFTSLRHLTPASQQAPPIHTPKVVRPFTSHNSSASSYERSPVERFRSGSRIIPYENRRSNVVEAALRLKKRSLKQRLGPRPRFAFQPYTSNRGRYSFRGGYFSRGSRGGRYMRRSQSSFRPRNWNSGGMRRWGSTTSLASNVSGRGRRGRGRGRGGRGRRRGRGGAFRGGRGPMPKKEDLDAELDQYMAGAKSVLDKDLDLYMSESNMN